MMNVMEEVDTALLDVRKAYRLVYLYQRRVLDLCDEIKKALSENLVFYFWAPSLYRSPPVRDDQSLCVRDAWVFLPLYDFCVFYLPEGVHNQDHNAGDWMLTVRISADSGYPDSGPREPDPLHFKDVASCESTVRLYVYYCSEPFKGNWYFEVFEGNQWPRDDGVGTFNRGIRTFGFKVSLSKMSNAEGVWECVERFSKEVRAALPLKLDHKTA